MSKLTVTNHNRNLTGLTYVYPVLSRRAGGLSIGINFNTNNACNWRCIYCQVPELKKGAAPDIHLDLLANELRFFLHSVLHGDFYNEMEVDPAQRVIKDIAIAGNGEPTSLKDFDLAVNLIGHIASEFGIFPQSHFVLITNGSLIHRPSVQKGLTHLSDYDGEVWFKMDSATPQGRATFNHSAQSNESVLKNLQLASERCTTKIQICLVDYKQQGLTETEKIGFIDFLKQVRCQTTIEHITLYTLARPSHQPEAVDLKIMLLDVMTALANDIRLLGFHVVVTQ
ncbi:MAG: Radical core protein [Pseudomonadota bacterium]|jgi:wyosine [tRNA(Phe)-imidazoG37] synthetase (radical SAM superfamily)|nr:Radical core protein [Pseudomonadota bacterium]